MDFDDEVTCGRCGKSRSESYTHFGRCECDANDWQMKSEFLTADEVERRLR